jgi:hypothetical protein
VLGGVEKASRDFSGEMNRGVEGCGHSAALRFGGTAEAAVST